MSADPLRTEALKAAKVICAELCADDFDAPHPCRARDLRAALASETTDAGLRDLAANRQVPDANRITITVGELRAALSSGSIDAERPRLRFGQEVILDCGPEWGGDKELIVGWVERTESLSVSGQFVSSGASREYVLQDGMDAPDEEAVARIYGLSESVE